ncbi:type I-E CRISPR-associated protein Cse2/CasB [Streptococcus troglodytae]|uniref:Type I-E CRISPR-associated protein Cse2/CasB n=1 Tax=Streptococcus troglodytae TaxID=1111760 RepID=A0A1L7LI64_9STRE|nr:type I-E CRISPR-associated protein Cse2/CasB [Streptococcus troglodytae]BAQ23877.1 uncharacterized protein SRT_06160 [Streptococcus troglodytae]
MSGESNVKMYSVTKRILIRLSKQQSTPAGKAMLARLRYSVGKPISEAKEAWPILFENVPENFLSQYEDPSYEEIAILTAIQLYALYQQGMSHNVFDDKAKKFQNIGYSLKSIRTGVDTAAVDRRFNTMITATTFEELVHHLRQLITLLKSKAPETKIDFARLATDLYWFLRDYQETVRLNWARQYYKHSSEEEAKNDN